MKKSMVILWAMLSVFGAVVSNAKKSLATPIIVGSVDTPGNAYDVHVSGSYANIADQHSGLQVIDVSDPITILL